MRGDSLRASPFFFFFSKSITKRCPVTKPWMHDKDVYSGALHWLYWNISLLVLNCRALNVDTANLRHRNAEPSMNRQRTFAQLVKSKKRCIKSNILFQCHHFPISLGTNNSESPLGQYSHNYGTTLMRLWDGTRTTMGRYFSAIGSTKNNVVRKIDCEAIQVL